MSKRTTVRSPEQHEDSGFSPERNASDFEQVTRSKHRHHSKDVPAMPNRTKARGPTTTAPRRTIYQRGRVENVDDNSHPTQWQSHLTGTSTVPIDLPYSYPVPGQMIPFYQGYDPQFSGINYTQQSGAPFYTDQRLWDTPTPPPPPPTDPMNDPAVEKLKKQMDELLAEKAMREQQSMQEYIQKTTLEVAVQQTAEVVREVQGQAQLDIEIATVKAEIMAQEKAERSQREKKQIQDQTRLEVEREFALKLAQEKAMREELIETIREEFREKERRAMELEEIIQRIRHEAERKAYHVHSASSIGTPHPTARRPPPVSVFNMEPRFEYEASFDDIDSNGPGTNHYQQYHSRTSSTGLSEESVRLPPPAPSAPSPSIVGGIYSHTTSAPSVVLSRASGVSRQQNRHMDFQSRSVQVNVPDLREIPMNHEEHVPNTRYQSWAIEDSDEEGSEAYKSARTSPIPMGGGDGNNPKEGRNQDSTTESRNGGEAVSGRFGLPFGSQKPAIPKKDGVSNQQGGTLPVSPPMNAGSTAEIGKNVRQSQNPSRDPGRILSSSVGQFTEERRTELGQHGQKMERHVGVAGSPVPTAKMQPANDGGHPREDRQTYTVAEGLLGGHMHFPHASLDQSYIYDGGDGRTESIQQYQPAIAPIRMVPMMVIMAPYQYQAPVTLPSGPIPPNLSGNPGHPGPHSRQNERTG